MRRTKRDIVSAMIFSKDGKLFQGRKDPAKGGVYVDCWHIPGGGIEEGEDKMTALAREMKEETGIDITPYEIELANVSEGESEKTDKETGETFICEMTFYDYKVTVDDRNADDIEISLDDDLVEYRWTDPSELSTLKLTPPSVALFTKLGLLKDD